MQPLAALRPDYTVPSVALSCGERGNRRSSTFLMVLERCALNIALILVSERSCKSSRERCVLRRSCVVTSRVTVVSGYFVFISSLSKATLGSDAQTTLMFSATSSGCPRSWRVLIVLLLARWGSMRSCLDNRLTKPPGGWDYCPVSGILTGA